MPFAPTIDEADQAIADAMRKNGLFQVLTDDFNAMLMMPRPVTALLTQCGEARAFFNPGTAARPCSATSLLAALLKSAPR